MEYLDVTDVAQMLKISIDSVRKKVQRGVLKAYKPDASRKMFFRPEDVQRYVEGKDHLDLT